MTYYIMSPMATVSDHKTRAEAAEALRVIEESGIESVKLLRERICFVEKFLATLTIETSTRTKPGHADRLKYLSERVSK